MRYLHSSKRGRFQTILRNVPARLSSVPVIKQQNNNRWQKARENLKNADGGIIGADSQAVRERPDPLGFEFPALLDYLPFIGCLTAERYRGSPQKQAKRDFVG